MFSYELKKDDGVIVLTARGQTTVDDYQAVAPQFCSDVRTHGIQKILVDARAFEGWDSAQSESIARMSWSEARSLFDRIAVVANDSSRRETASFMEFFRNAGKDVRQFQAIEYDAAVQWLTQQTAQTD